jgi:hypothetical protein
VSTCGFFFAFYAAHGAGVQVSDTTRHHTYSTAGIIKKWSIILKWQSETAFTRAAYL